MNVNFSYNSPSPISDKREGLIKNAETFFTLRASRASRSFQVALATCQTLHSGTGPSASNKYKKTAYSGSFVFGGDTRRKLEPII